MTSAISAPASAPPSTSTTITTTAAAAAAAASTTNSKIYQLSIPLPHAPYTRLRLHLSILQSAIMLFLTTTTDMGSLDMSTRTGAEAGAEAGFETGEEHEKTKENEDGDRGEEEEEELHGVSTAASLAPMGSFVYALPDLSASPAFTSTTSTTTTARKQPLVTPLYPNPPSTLDFATRCARVLAHRLRRPVYVGSSISEMDLGMGMQMQMEVQMGSGLAAGGSGDGTADIVRRDGETGVLERIVDVVTGIVNKK